MRQSMVSGICWLAPPLSAFAVHQEHLDLLLQTNACFACDLQNADLSRMELAGANLAAVNLLEPVRGLILVRKNPAKCRSTC